MTSRARWTGLVAATLIVGAAAMTWRSVRKPAEFDTFAVDRGTVDEVLVEDGRTRSRWHVDLTATVSGEWEPVGLRVGDTVRAGQPLGTLRAGALDPSTAEQARARVGVAEAALIAARAAAGEAQLAAREATRARDRMERLAPSGGVSAEQLDRVRAEDEARRAALEAALARVNAAGHEVEAARALAAGGGTVSIRAPAAGIVLRVDEEHARVVLAGTPLLQVGALGAPEVVVRVLSGDATRLRPGIPMVVVVGGDTIAGTVTRIEPAAQTVRSALGVEEQRVPVIGELDAKGARLGHEFQVEVQLLLASHRDELRVPLGALVRDEGKWIVFVLDARGRATSREVTLVARGRDFAAIRGLAEGTLVVVYPPDELGQSGAGSR